MKPIDNISPLFGDDLKGAVNWGTRLRIAASAFSIDAFEALKTELSKIENLQFVFTTPAFVPAGATFPALQEEKN